MIGLAICFALMAFLYFKQTGRSRAETLLLPPIPPAPARAHAPPRPAPSPTARLLRAASVCLALLGAGSVAEVINDDGGEASAAAPAAQLAFPAEGETFTVDIASLVPVLRDFSSKEVQDQMRDWALYGTLSRIGYSEATLAKATHGKVPVRWPYLEELFPFEYGRGRRAVIDEPGQERVLLFHDESDPQPTVTVARLADRVRMETGEIPASFDVFEVDPDLEQGVIHITRRATVVAADAFGPAYGYVEAYVDDLDSFSSWIDQVDDVTFAKEERAGVRFGGRRFQEARERPATLEDVAVLYRAQAGVAEARRKLELDLASAKDNYEAMMRTGQLRQAEAQSRYEKTAAELMRTADVHDPGFSLDPHWRGKELTATLEGMSKSARNALRSLVAKKLRESSIHELDACMKLHEEDATPIACHAALDFISWLLGTPPNVIERMEAANGGRFGILASSLKALTVAATTDSAGAIDAVGNTLLDMRKEARQDPQPESQALADAIQILRDTSQLQCARYDGPVDPSRSIRGTRVGMNLFYTDLLAKLWESVDYHHSAPTVAVTGFLSGPRMDLEEKWDAELKSLPSTRVWFGPRREASSRSTNDDVVSFSHIASRVFAAGSDGGSPKEEAQPNEDSRRTFGWWDRHFEDVAAYEQEYALQNQIMKWSVLTQWMVHSGRLHFLDDPAIQVRRDLRFDTWYEQEKVPLDLKYKLSIPMRRTEDSITGTECMDLLVSYPFFSAGAPRYISGGVSLAGEEAAALAPRLVPSEARAIRMAESLSASAEEGAVGSAIKAELRYEGAGKLSSIGDASTRTRWASVDIDLGHEVETNVVRRAAGETSISMRAAGGQDLGEFSAHPEQDSVWLSWRPGAAHDTARAQALGEVVHTTDIEASGGARDLVSALKVGDDESALQALVDARRATGPGVADALEEARATAQTEARASLAGGDGPGTIELLKVARAGARESSAQMVDRGLAELESGVLARARATLSGAELGPLPRDASPTIARLYNEGFGDGEVISLVRGDEVQRPIGSVVLTQDLGRIEPLLRVNRPLLGTSLSSEARLSAVEQFGGRAADGKAGELTIYIDDTFGLNHHDLEQSGEGVLGELAREPDVSWQEVDLSASDYVPERLGVDTARYRKVPAPRWRPRGEARVAGALSRAILVRRGPPSRTAPPCDPSKDPNCPPAGTREHGARP